MVKFLHETYPEGAHYAACGGVGVRNGAAGRIVLPYPAAVEAGAERIGHGVDVMFEDRPHELLKEMGRST